MFTLLLLSSLGGGTAGPQEFPASFGCWDGGYGGCVEYSGYGGYSGYVGYGAYGCCGGSYGWWGGGYDGYDYAASGYAPAAAHTMPPAGWAKTVPSPKQDKEAAASTRAKLIVEVPADAKLYIDDQLTQTGSDRRVFSTPELEVGRAYHYVVRAEVTRDGRKVEQTKRVIVRPGEEALASFTDMDAVAAARADK
jgi:uncharacterized protein (TIGR03000 family)